MTKSVYTGLLILILFVMAVSWDGRREKMAPLSKSAALSIKRVSTGLATVGADSANIGAWVEHRLEGSTNANALYQGFIAFHFDEMDTMLTVHSPAGRTNAGIFSGDKSTFSKTGYTASLQTGLSEERYTVSTQPITNFSKIKLTQILTAPKNNERIVYLDFIFEFAPKDSLTDPRQYSNFRFLMGYDGDIGTTTGGMNNDSTGYYGGNQTGLAYIYDAVLSLYSGVALHEKSVSDSAGNFGLWHQTVNANEFSTVKLDTLMHEMMMHPSWNSTVQNTDAMVYWTLNRGTIVPDDFVPYTDTIRFTLVNGLSKNTVIEASKGIHVPDVLPPGEPSSPLPTTFVLFNNSPNPFNPSTTIRFYIPEPMFVRLTVYNLLGQKVRTLIARAVESGIGQVVWDARNDVGQTVAAGVYLYRMETPQGIITRRMLLLK
ncbi:T9SS type A sorting domain-containing protein [bacterium]|nr:T9SS type A sorting domain-containing protein [bacterium]NUN45240.1 T9SS type A sorting domain-containing protein [bacterium]